MQMFIHYIEAYNKQIKQIHIVAVIIVHYD